MPRRKWKRLGESIGTDYRIRTGLEDERVPEPLVADDPKKRPLKVRWILTGEVVERLTAGRDERVPPSYPDALLESNERMAKVKLPAKDGAYRLFAYVHDDAGLAAVANVPLYVEGR